MPFSKHLIVRTGTNTACLVDYSGMKQHLTGRQSPFTTALHGWLT